MSTYDYSRALVAGAYDITSALARDVAAALPGLSFRMRCENLTASFVFVAVLDAGQIAILDAAVAVHKATMPLEAAKDRKLTAIDRRSDELLTEGFVYDSKTFSLSVKAQSKMMGMHQIRNDATVTYPIVWSTLDDGSSISLADAATVHSFVLAALGALRSVLDSGTTLKISVVAATTIVEVDAVVDTR